MLPFSRPEPIKRRAGVLRFVLLVFVAMGVVIACSKSETAPGSADGGAADDATTDAADAAPVEAAAAADVGIAKPCDGAPAGKACGMGMVCNGAGACVECAAGTTCKPSGACNTAAISCTTGAPVCADDQNVPNGTFCGDADAGLANDLVCAAGVCVPCTVGAACTPANGCHKGHLKSCNGHADACIDELTNADDGTICGANQVCNGGACVACVANVACTPANECHQGLTSCATGTSVCVDQNMDVADGGACGLLANGTVCTAGICGCAADKHACADGICYSNDDAAHCGASCMACGAPARGTPICASGVCGFKCGNSPCEPNFTGVTSANACNAAGTQCACGSNAACGSSPPSFQERCEANGTCACDQTTCAARGGCCFGGNVSCIVGDFSRCRQGNACSACNPTSADRCLPGANAGCSCGPAVGGLPNLCPAGTHCAGATCVP